MTLCQNADIDIRTVYFSQILSKNNHSTKVLFLIICSVISASPLVPGMRLCEGCLQSFLRSLFPLWKTPFVFGNTRYCRMEISPFFSFSLPVSLFFFLTLPVWRDWPVFCHCTLCYEIITRGGDTRSLSNAGEQGYKTSLTLAFLPSFTTTVLTVDL